MLSQQLLSLLMVELIPVFVGIAIYLYLLLVQRMPAQQRETLDHLTWLAVAKVEQLYNEAGGEQKKDLAMHLVSDLFRAFRLPVPPAAAIDAAIEASVLMLKQVKPATSESTSTPNTVNA